MELASKQNIIRQHPHEQRAGMPAGGNQAANKTGLRGNFIDMEGLRVEFAGKGDDRLT